MSQFRGHPVYFIVREVSSEKLEQKFLQNVVIGFYGINIPSSNFNDFVLVEWFVSLARNFCNFKIKSFESFRSVACENAERREMSYNDTKTIF